MTLISENYKFRDLKVYCSTEWLADNKKKYRQVFDRYEVSYIYAELSFYNRMFDRDDWDLNVNIKCFSMKKGRKEICDLNFDRKVSKYDNVVYIREGWGNAKAGAFWKRGTYYWEAYINGEKVATKYFYVEDGGMSIADENPFLELHSVKLYEAPYDDLPLDQREYLTVFSQDETRYVYVELQFDNVQYNRDWYCEVFVRFFNSARELKGQTTRLQRIEKNMQEFEITASWGSNVKGSWRPDQYTAEIIFMDKLLATVLFSVGDKAVPGVSGIILPESLSPVYLTKPSVDKASFEQVLGELDELIGLQHVKTKVREHAKYLQFLNLRREKGFKEDEAINIHSVFSGNPGTGKTTVAKMMGKLYQKMGLLTKGHVHEVDRVDLVGEYIGQTAPKVKEAIERARGGVLFIDEAYALARTNDDSKDFGREVIEILVKEMSEGNKDLAVVVAGYPKEMKHFLDSNPGLKSRFKLFFDFDDYLPQELSEIAAMVCKRKGIELSVEAWEMVNEIITNAYRNRDRSFGNARFVADIIEQAKIHLGLRVMDTENPRETSQEDLALVLPVDISKIQLKRTRRLPNIPIDYKLLDDAMAELNSMIGIGNIKEEIGQMVQLVRYYRETEKDVLNRFFLHTVFVGNPGTGKTTVARILTKIYKALGVLERGHMVETDRQGLVAGFIGQTAIKTAEKIDDSMGGVLFIDEAYALTESAKGGHQDYGNEAIQTLLKRMEDHRGEFFVFVAGYPENMESFLKTNPGLKSRFDRILRFEDYSSEELYEIALQMLQHEGLTPTEDATAHLKKYLAFLYDFRDKYFGNARTVRNIITDALKNQSLRLASIDPSERSDDMKHLLTYDDVKDFKTDKNSDKFYDKPSIGFRSKPSTGKGSTQ